MRDPIEQARLGMAKIRANRKAAGLRRVEYWLSEVEKPEMDMIYRRIEKRRPADKRSI